MRVIRHIIKKEFLQIRQDKQMLRVSLVAPVLQLIILGYAATFDVNDIRLAVIDQDRSPSSREVVRNFVSTGYFKVVGQMERISEIDHQLDDGHAAMVLVIPRGFARDLGRGTPAPLQLIADGTETSSANVGLNYAAIIVTRYSQQIVLERLMRQGTRVVPAKVQTEFRVWYNPDLKSRNFMVPGVLGLLLMVMTMILTSLAVVKEKEMGTLEQLIVTPIKPHQLIIGKLTPFLVIGLADVLIVIATAAGLFNLPVKGSEILLLVLCLVFLMTTLGLGLFISTVSRTQQQAMMTAIFFFMMPMIFFSGFVFPIENMPLVIQYVSYLMPLRYFFVIVRGLFLKGVGMDVLWPQAAALVAFGAAILSLSVIRFHKKVG